MGIGSPSRIPERRHKHMHELQAGLGQLHSLCRSAGCIASHRSQLHLPHPLAPLHRASGSSSHRLEGDAGRNSGTRPEPLDPCRLATIRVLSRQSRRIDLVKVTKLKPLNEWSILMTVHRLPGSVPERADIWQEPSLPQWQDFDIVVDTSDGLQVGNRLLYLKEDLCLVPATQENLTAAGWALAKDGSTLRTR